MKIRKVNLRREEKFREEYIQKFPCIAKSAVSANHILCTVCKLDFKIAHGGMTDIERPVKSLRRNWPGRVASLSG